MAHTATHKNGNLMGINIRADIQKIRAGVAHVTDYADMILEGEKVLETRKTRSLDAYIGKRVAIVRTGMGKAQAIGTVEVGKPFFLEADDFDAYVGQHRVVSGSAFYVAGSEKGKWCYPMLRPVKWAESRDVKHGIIARQVI